MSNTNNRDDFGARIRTALMMRAGNRCSFPSCSQITSGPSAESSSAVANIGKAAHISAAAPGGPRFDPALTPEQRASIENGIWLCSSHADLIDRDVVTYAIKALERMKAEHEARINQLVRERTSASVYNSELIALGADIVLLAGLGAVEEGVWQFEIESFVRGDFETLSAFADGFSRVKPADRHVICNALGDGRVLAGPPTLTRVGQNWRLRCPIAPRFPRIRADQLGTDLAVSEDANDLFLKNGDFATVRGVDAFPQKLRLVLSMQKGESKFTPEFGARLVEYYAGFHGSIWLDHLVKLEVIRQAAIPFRDSVMRTQYTPLQCVDLVKNAEILPEEARGRRLCVRLNLDVNGLGPWQGDLWIYMIHDNPGATTAKPDRPHAAVRP
jgi:hypothetical protein